MPATTTKGCIVNARTTLAAALATTAALVAPTAAEASATTSARAADCWATPGNAYPWNLTCIAGPYSGIGSCIVGQSGVMRSGALVKSCKWRRWNGRVGYFFFYSGHKA
jgi:hypothetical protein